MTKNLYSSELSLWERVTLNSILDFSENECATKLEHYGDILFHDDHDLRHVYVYENVSHQFCSECDNVCVF